MQQKKIRLSILLLFCLGLTGLQAQEAIPVSGGNASGTGGSVSYTVGQIIFTTNTGANGSVAQGVQQPYEISVVNGIVEYIGITLQCNAYPNPVNDFVILKVVDYSISNLSYQLYDINGKLLEIKNIEDNETSISMQKFLPSTYFLKVMQGSAEVKTFKIVKN